MKLMLVIYSVIVFLLVGCVDTSTSTPILPNGVPGAGQQAQVTPINSISMDRNFGDKGVFYINEAFASKYLKVGEHALVFIYDDPDANYTPRVRPWTVYRFESTSNTFTKITERYESTDFAALKTTALPGNRFAVLDHVYLSDDGVSNNGKEKFVLRVFDVTGRLLSTSEAAKDTWCEGSISPRAQGGYFSFCDNGSVRQFNADGSPDNSSGTDPYRPNSTEFNLPGKGRVYYQTLTSGRVAMWRYTGSFQYKLWMLNDGRIDQTFAAGAGLDFKIPAYGIKQEYIADVALNFIEAKNGAFYVSVQESIANTFPESDKEYVFKIQNNGALDKSFGVDGKVFLQDSTRGSFSFRSNPMLKLSDSSLFLMGASFGSNTYGREAPFVFSEKGELRTSLVESLSANMRFGTPYMSNYCYDWDNSGVSIYSDAPQLLDLDGKNFFIFYTAKCSTNLHNHHSAIGFKIEVK